MPCWDTQVWPHLRQADAPAILLVVVGAVAVAVAVVGLAVRRSWGCAQTGGRWQTRASPSGARWLSFERIPAG